MATCAHNPSHVSKPKQKILAGGKEEWANSPCSFLTKKSNWGLIQGNQAFENGLRAVPSIFYHPLPDVNNAQGLSYQLKSKG